MSVGDCGGIPEIHTTGRGYREVEFWGSERGTTSVNVSLVIYKVTVGNRWEAMWTSAQQSAQRGKICQKGKWNRPAYSDQFGR